MKKVIKNTVYDSDLSHLAASWSEFETVAGVRCEISHEVRRTYVPTAPGAFRKGGEYEPSVIADLSKIDPRQGRFFLVTRVAVRWDNSPTGTRFTVLDDEEARHLVETYGSFDSYVKFFGEPDGMCVPDDGDLP